MKRQMGVVLLQIFLLLLVVQLANSRSESQITFLGAYCLSSDLVTINSTYSNNILSVLSNLTSLSSTTNFSTFTTGTGLDLVSGLFFCRPDLPLNDCKDCVFTSTRVFELNCANRKEAIIWYDECMVRYSNHTLLRNEETKPFTWYHSYLNVSRPDLFPSLLNQTLEGLIIEASSQEKHFATVNSTSFTLFEGLYGLAVCTPDITALECDDCLRTASSIIPICCGGFSQWTMVSLPSCQLRYDTAPFIISPPSPPLP